MSRQLARQIKLTNILISVLFGLAVLLLFPIVYENGWIVSAYLDIFSIIVLFALLGLNHLGFNNASRLVASIYPPFIALLASILVKINHPDTVVVYDFFDARLLASGFVIVPFLLFSYREKTLMFTALSVSVVGGLGFDVISNLFGVGYTRFFGAMPKAYIVSGIYFDLVLLFVVGSIYYFKANIEGLLQKNATLANDLGEKNMELSQLFEELENSNIELKKNEFLINEQKELLEKANAGLLEQVEHKTTELRLSNEELVRHNNELQQVSHTISHNLRGPVANLLGLAQLFKMDRSEEQRGKIANHILKSAESLDGIIKDLNKVIELRNDLFQIKEKIEIQKEIEEVWFVLDNNIKQCGAKLLLNIEMPVLYGVRSYFQSIIYNLVSNAIKYRHFTRDCIIRFSSRSEGDKCIIEVQDNGIGVDLSKYRSKIFGMYKRFNDHTEGKGLGLFLAKQQIDSMKGTISVESKLNVGTRFILELPSIPLSLIESQLFYKSNVADIYLDAVNDITSLQWKKMPTPFEFKEVFMNNIEVFKTYISERWIVDLSLMVKRSSLEQRWVLEDAIDQYVRVGIKKVAVIRTVNNEDKIFWDEFYKATKQKSIEVVFAESTADAKEKLLNV